MKSEYHLGTILLTNEAHLHEKSRHLTSVTVIEPAKSTLTESHLKAIGFNTSQAKGSNRMSTHDDPRITHKVNLAAAFHDHISCTKLPSQISKNGGDINSLIGVSLNNGSCINTNNSLFGAAAGSHNEDKIQIKKLKDMILVQLDLIQHQQEQLLKKERQLQGLRNDRETLCSKIEKMENQINFLSRKLLETNSGTIVISDATHSESISELNAQSSDSEMMISCMSDTNDVTNSFTNVYSTPSPSSTSNPTIVSPRTCNSNLSIASHPNHSPQLTSGTEILSSGDNEDTSDNNKPKSTSNLVKKKIKIEINKKKTEKKNNSSKKDTKKSSLKRKKPLNTKNSVQPIKEDLLSLTGNPVNRESIDEKTEPCIKKRKRSGSKCSNSASDQQSVNNVDSKPMSANVNFVENNESLDLYSCHQERSLSQRTAFSHDISIKADQIEVPSWRIIYIPDSYSTDGIENLEDEFFLRRHQKLESDERRRKRWDIQRLREQKLNERLRSGRCYTSTVNFDTSGSTDISDHQSINFFPGPKEVKFIEISDKIPGMAFGLPIPNLPPKNFSLPWLKSSRRT